MELIAVTRLIEPSLKSITVKSPLRYPGGKSRAIKQILPIIPEFEEMREPMVGGGSVYFALKNLFPNKRFWINDLNKDLFLFWKYCNLNVQGLVEEIKRIKKNRKNGRGLFNKLTNPENKFTDFERAVRFFVLNRITFSGIVDSGGFSKQAFLRRFTDSSIKRVESVGPLLEETQVTNQDYEEVIHAPGENVFIFLDPPYLSKTESKLYGKNGSLHTSFDHERFAEDMKRCHHKWLITYDNFPEVIELFKFANIYTWELQYGMNNYKQKSAAKGQELFISNYEIPSLSHCKIN